MAKKELTNEYQEMVSVCKYLRDENMKGFDDLKKIKESGNITDAYLDYEMARDRKSAIVLKSILVEIGIQRMNSRRIL